MRAALPSLPRRRRSIGPVLVALAFALAIMPAGGSGASTTSKLHDARARLASLTAQIRSEEAQASALQSQLASLDQRIAQASNWVHRIARQLAVTRSQLAAARAEYQTLRDRLDSLARNAYMQGPGGSIDVILGATSFGDLNDRVQFLTAVSQETVDLADQTANLAGRLADTSKHLGGLLSVRRALLAQLGREQQSKAAAIANVRVSLANLGHTRSQIVALVAKLRRKLQAQEIASIGTSFQGGHNLPYGRWAGVFLRTMSVSECHRNFVLAVSWQVAEFTQASWNPLATTYPMPGSTVYNWAGVRNYVSLAQGLQATRLTIEGGLSAHGYGAIVSALSRCADPMTTARAINASDWCRGCAGGNYVTDMVPKVEANYAVYAAL